MTEQQQPAGNGRQTPGSEMGVPSWLPPVIVGVLALGILRRRTLRRLLAAGAAAAVAYRVADQSGLVTRLRFGRGPTPLTVTRSVTIARPRQEVYAFWRDFTNLPRFMHDLESVEVTGERTSRWVARGPRGSQRAWDVEVTEDRPGEVIAWQSVEGAPVWSRGTVRFHDAPGGNGTEVHLTLATLSAGTFGLLSGPPPAQQVQEDLRRAKQLIETGNITTTEGQPTGPGGGTQQVERIAGILRRIAAAVERARDRRSPGETTTATP